MRFLRKTVALILSFSMLDFGGVGRDAFAGSTESFDPQSLIKPMLEQYAHLEEFHPSSQKNEPFFVHIRDLHCNFEAQMNIAKTLEILARESKGKELLVLVEGAEGLVDTSF